MPDKYGRLTAEEILTLGPIRPDNALTCGRCGCPTDVRDSRPANPYGFTTMRRRRRCSGCDHRYSTVEVTIEEVKRLLSLPERVKAVQGALVTLRENIDRLEV